MTRKLFWDDPYRSALDTVVASVDGETVRLAETIFYAFSGGQESDHGCIGGLPVLEARRQGHDIAYTLPAGHGLHSGMPVTVEIDWPRRYRLMRLHFAAELVLELVCARCPGIDRIGAHIGADKARIDFTWPQPLTPLLPDLHGQVSALIEADRPIISAFSDAANERRYWEVEGIARVACGGTHLRRTGEVGVLALKRRNVGKGKERVEILLADG